MAVELFTSRTDGTRKAMSGEFPSPPPPALLVPPPVEQIEDTGIEPGFISDLILKVVYFHSVIPAGHISEVVRLPFSGVIDALIDDLRINHYVEVQGAEGPLRVSYRYVLTDKGHRKVDELLRRSNYAGPCPVTLEDYTYMMSRQRARDAHVTRERVEEAFAPMVLEAGLLEQLGPAINAGRSMFIFGPSGNGKTTIAEIATACLGGHVYIPHAVMADGEIIRVFDEEHHREVEDPNARVDRRWVRSIRPTVVVGGELNLAALDLNYSPRSKTYEAPLQMKANGGMFLIDDFGRQQCSPTELLNRWIVPLEKHVDYLNLASGSKIKVPFEELIVFATNLKPGDLVDTAFLRRLQYKIEVHEPTPENFKAIFENVVAARGIQYVESAYQYLLTEYYKRRGFERQACHPRDLIEHLINAAAYYGVTPALRKDLIDLACHSYFVHVT